jgi:hypothetical protein
MKMLRDERELISTNERLLTLTTHRVRVDAKVAGRTRLVSISLDAVVSCGVTTRSHPLLLGVAVLVGLIGVFGLIQKQSGSEGALAVAAVFAIAYFLTRAATLKVASAGDAIEVPASGMSHARNEPRRSRRLRRRS